MSLKRPGNLSQAKGIYWRLLSASAALALAGTLAWPGSVTAAVAYEGELPERVRMILVVAGSLIGLAALCAPRIRRIANWLDTRIGSKALGGAVLALTVAAAVPRLYQPVEFVKLGAPDHVEYALGAWNLVHHGRYSIELNGVNHPPRYPFGYSASFIAPVLAVSGGDPRSAVFASLGCAVGVLLLIGRLTRCHFGDVAAAGSVGALLICPLFVKYATEVFAEQAVTLLLLAILGLILRATSVPHSSSDSIPAGPRLWLSSLALGLAVGLATAVKFSLALLMALPLMRAFWAWRPHRRRLTSAATLLLGFALGSIPLLVYNAVRFGAPLRSGYHYWCSIPYDFAALTFSPRYLVSAASGGGHGNVVGYLLPSGVAPGSRTVELGLCIAFWMFVVAGIAAALQRRSRRLNANCYQPDGLRACRYTWMASLAALLLAGFYGVYFFQDARLMLPVYVSLVPVAVSGCFRLLGAPDSLCRSRVAGVAALAMVCAAMWGLGPRWSRPSQQIPREMDAARNRLVEAAARHVPDDGLIISNLDGAVVGHYLLRGTQRRYLPLDRNVEYASKYAQRRAPKLDAAARLVTDDPFAHRAVRLPGSAEVYPQTALEVLQQLGAQKQTYWLVLEAPFDVAGRMKLEARKQEVHREFRVKLVERLKYGEIWSFVGRE